jgi:hypothetical protein
MSMASTTYSAICSISSFVLFTTCSLRALGAFAVRNVVQFALARSSGVPSWPRPELPGRVNGTVDRLCRLNHQKSA